ncbi:MAG: 4Fe-4S binding protein, partial [Bacillota bacterium]|nr:4Fe-4S binding protein [Bacillota bacterium]
ENYSVEMLEQNGRRRYINHFIPGIQHSALTNIGRLAEAKRRFPAVYRFVRTVGNYRMKKIHYGQVVPLEDAEKIIDMCSSITRVACVCRSVTAGSKNARYCLMLGIDPTDTQIDYADLRDSLETVSHAEAKELLGKFDREGLVHSVWTFKTPFIGGLCNCDRDCLAYRLQISSNLMDIMFKAEYVAVVNTEDCVGCRNCLKLCQFGAIEYSLTNGKCSINPLKCYGCGVCRSACKKEAITLMERPDGGC